MDMTLHINVMELGADTSEAETRRSDGENRVRHYQDGGLHQPSGRSVPDLGIRRRLVSTIW